MESKSEPCASPTGGGVFESDLMAVFASCINNVQLPACNPTGPMVFNSDEIDSSHLSNLVSTS